MKKLTNFKIASFLHNNYSKRLTSDPLFPVEIIQTMKSQNGVENTLADAVYLNDWQRKKLSFSSEDLENFPEMTEKDLRIFYTDSYQLKQAISYLSEIG